MRILAIAVAGLCVLHPGRAGAESGEEMRARGEQLAKDGRYTEAIDAFKAAERIEPRARHFCLIALAYVRRELWPQAEIFLEQCETKATAADPVPEWVPTAKQQLQERLSTVNVAPVTIKVEPANTEVKLAVSSFAPDELFDPRTIHLPPGRHVIIATAKGFNDAQKTVEVVDKTPQDVVITMLPLSTGPGPEGPGPTPIAGPSEPRSKVPLYVMIGGGVLVAAGGASHLFWYKGLRDDLEAAGSGGNEAEYNRILPKFNRARGATIALYGVGGAAVITGLILNFTVFKGKEAPAQVSMVPYDGGGMLTVGWSR
ncbi:MAG: hypothetical protein AB7T06_24265 [Kofleriaceae bacterium]